MNIFSCRIPAKWQLHVEEATYIGMPPEERMFDYSLPEYVLLPDDRIIHVTLWSDDLPKTAIQFELVENPTDEVYQIAKQNKPSPAMW